MIPDSSSMLDDLAAVSGYHRGPDDASFLRGDLHVVLTGPDGELKLDEKVTNQITQVGEQRYGEAGALGTGATVAAPTGMALGTGTTAVAKTGAGAALVTGIAGSAVAIGTPASALNGSNLRQITYTCTWSAGTATANAISEVVLQNGTATTVPTNAATTNILSRALLSPTVNKGSGDSLTITWTHTIGSP